MATRTKAKGEKRTHTGDMVVVRVNEANEHLEGLYTTGGEVWSNLFCAHIEILILPVRQPQQYDHERHTVSASSVTVVLPLAPP
jgi:hypothetical protein